MHQVKEAQVHHDEVSSGRHGGPIGPPYRAGQGSDPQNTDHEDKDLRDTQCMIK